MSRHARRFEQEDLGGDGDGARGGIVPQADYLDVKAATGHTNIAVVSEEEVGMGAQLLPRDAACLMNSGSSMAVNLVHYQSRPISRLGEREREGTTVRNPGAGSIFLPQSRCKTIYGNASVAALGGHRKRLENETAHLICHANSDGHNMNSNKAPSEN